jgi:methyl-accepting chemotaxis protein
MRHSHSVLYSLSRKIIILPVFAILILLLVTLVGYLMSLKTQKSVTLGKTGSEIELTMQKLLRGEQTFIRTGDKVDKERVDQIHSELKSVLGGARRLSSEKEVLEIIVEIETENEQHTALFNSLVDKVGNLQRYNANMDQHFIRLQELLVQKKEPKDTEDWGILGSISEYESEVSMEGDDLPLEYLNVREYIRQLTNYLQSVQINAQNLMLRNDGQQYVEGRSGLLNQKSEILRNARSQIQRLNQPDYNKLWDKVEKQLDTLSNLLGRKIVNDENSGRQLQDAALFEAWKSRQAVMAQLETNSLQIQNLAQRLIEQTQVSMEKSRRLSNWINFWAVLVAAVIMLISGIWVSRSIIRPLVIVTHSAENMAEGNINVDIEYDSQDELGRMATAFRSLVEAQGGKAEAARQIAAGNLAVKMIPSSDGDVLGHALSQMIEKLNEILSQVNSTASEVRQGAAHIANTSDSLSKGAAVQASSIEELTGSIEEISIQTKTIAENASDASSMTTNASQAAERGHKEIENIVDAMRGISDSSEEIGRIIKVIDEIAFQTNLLALNAAVEAAHAGKNGKGFAVVADEVRNLAGRSSKAASETAELIKTAVLRVEHGVKTVDRTSSVLKNIVQEVSKVSDLVYKIAKSSDEQAGRISQINSGLLQIEGVTQQNVSAAEESAEGSKVLSSQAMELNNQLNNFNFQS